MQKIQALRKLYLEGVSNTTQTTNIRDVILRFWVLKLSQTKGGNTKMVDLIVQSKVRAYIKKKGLNTGGDALPALDKRVAQLIDDAASRAKGNDRKTLMAKDC